jgi:hypothetical protein
MHCPRCGTELTIYEEHKGYRWLYRQYPCAKCKVVWDWASLIRHRFPDENRWKLEECRAWEVVGIPIIEEYYKTHSGGD